MKRSHKPLLVVFALLLLLSAIPGFAAPMPSKTAAEQSLESRAADLVLVTSIAGSDQIASALADQGYTKEEVASRLAALSTEDLRSLAQNLEQIQAAGITREQWYWIGIGAYAAVILVIAIG